MVRFPNHSEMNNDFAKDVFLDFTAVWLIIKWGQHYPLCVFFMAVKITFENYPDLLMWILSVRLVRNKKITQALACNEYILLLLDVLNGLLHCSQWYNAPYEFSKNLDSKLCRFLNYFGCCEEKNPQFRAQGDLHKAFCLRVRMQCVWKVARRLGMKNGFRSGWLSVSL